MWTERGKKKSKARRKQEEEVVVGKVGRVLCASFRGVRGERGRVDHVPHEVWRRHVLPLLSTDALLLLRRASKYLYPAPRSCSLWSRSRRTGPGPRAALRRRDYYRRSRQKRVWRVAKNARLALHLHRRCSGRAESARHRGRTTAAPAAAQVTGRAKGGATEPGGLARAERGRVAGQAGRAWRLGNSGRGAGQARVRIRAAGDGPDRGEVQDAGGQAGTHSQGRGRRRALSERAGCCRRLCAGPPWWRAFDSVRP